MVYENPERGSVMAMGARFMPEKELHIGLFSGDAETCLEFAAQEGKERGVERLSCLFPASAAGIQGSLTGYGFKLLPSDFIVMEAHLEK